MNTMEMMNCKGKMNMPLAQKVSSNELNKSFHVNSRLSNQLLHLIKCNIQGTEIQVKVRRNKDLPEVSEISHSYHKNQEMKIR